MTRTGKRIITALAVLIGVEVLVVVFFDWIWLKGPIEHRVSSATGRSFGINGDLDVELSLHPLVRVQGIVLGNAEWGSAPEMLTMDELAFRIDLLKLLRGQVVLPEVHLQRPRLLLEENAEAKANWQFNAQQQQEKSGAAPQISDLDIQDGTVAYKNPKIATDVTVGLNTTTSGPDQRPGRRLQGHGRYQGEEFRLHGETGGVLALRDTEHPYPIALEATAGKVKAKVDGALPIPLGFSTVDLNLDLQGPDFAKLYPLIPVSLPESPPFKLKGHLLHSDNTWHFENFSGEVGDSDLSGNFKVTLGERVAYTADVTSHRLAFKDIAGFVHAKDKVDDNDSPKEAGENRPGGKVLSQRPYNFERLNVTDADVRFKGKQVVATRLPLDDVEAHFKLENGHLTIDPLNFGVAGGTIASRLTLDARKAPMDASLDLRARRLQLGKLIPSLEEKVGEGTIDLKQEQLDLQLRAHGKRASPLALHGPIHLGGKFSKVDVGVDKGEVTARVGAATALGVLLGPLAAFLPVVEWGLTEDSNCGALLR